MQSCGSRAIQGAAGDGSGGGCDLRVDQLSHERAERAQPGVGRHEHVTQDREQPRVVRQRLLVERRLRRRI
eukprot:2524568-Prymnesium_polylepis.1